MALRVRAHSSVTRVCPGTLRWRWAPRSAKERRAPSGPVCHVSDLGEGQGCRGGGSRSRAGRPRARPLWRRANRPELAADQRRLRWRRRQPDLHFRLLRPLLRLLAKGERLPSLLTKAEPQLQMQRDGRCSSRSGSCSPKGSCHRSLAMAAAPFAAGWIGNSINVALRMGLLPPSKRGQWRTRSRTVRAHGRNAPEG